MLDQNTDRMWYVIGAVIVGAALIFIMNNIFPQLFASIGETFVSTTEQTTDLTDGIGPLQQNALHDADWERGYLNHITGVEQTSASTSDDYMNYYTVNYLPTNGATSVTLELKTTTKPMVPVSVNNAFVAYDATKTMISYTNFRTVSYADGGSDGIQPFKYTKALPDGTKTIRIQLLYGNAEDYVLTFK